jgi:hypothetical protein
MKIFYYSKLMVRFCSFLIISIFILTIQSCVKDNFELNKLAKTEWDGNLAVPLVYSSLSMKDIIKSDANSLIQIGADNFCTLVYKGNLFSVPASTLVNIPDQPLPSIHASLTAAQIAALSSAGTVTITNSVVQTFATGNPGPLIDSVLFRSGHFLVNLNSNFKNSGQVTIAIPSAKKNGLSFSKTLSFTYNGTLPVIVNDSTTLDIAGYNFDMTNGSGSSNQFNVIYTIKIFANSTPPSAVNQIDISQTISNIKFSRLYGDIGQIALGAAADTVDISIFKNALGTGSFTLVDPSIIFKFSNSYGVPIRASVATLEGYNPGFAPFPITGCPNQLPIFSPNFSQIGLSLTSQYTLDKNNSNVVPFINNLPKFMVFAMNSTTNPNGATHANFVTDSSQLKIDLELDLPLFGTAKNFVLQDTIPFTVDEQISNDVDWAMIRAYTNNGFPLDINMQVYFVDTLYNKLDSLVIPNQLILKSAHVNTSGIVTSSTENIYDGKITNDRLGHLKKTKYILVKSVAATANNGVANVKIYADYKLDIRLGLQVKFKKKV